MATWLERLPSNVGEKGGDLAARRFAFVVVAALTLLAIPPFQISASTLRICALIASMAGTLFLMAGLAFLQKTHYAGVSLIAIPLGMSALVGWALPWLAVGFGIVVLAVMGQNLVTRKCGFNKMMGVNSWHHQNLDS
jgi:hypothetical protein